MRNRGISIVAVVLSLAFLLGGLACSQAQLQKARSDADAFASATTRPAVVAIAGGAAPITGGVSTLALAAAGTLATIAAAGIGLFVKSGLNGVTGAVKDHAAAMEGLLPGWASPNPVADSAALRGVS